MLLLERFRNHLWSLELPTGRALVAVSGGPDSVALLDLLVRTQNTHRLGLVVTHVDHGIHPESAQVADRVQSLATHYQLPFEGTRLALGPSAGETLARSRRYAWLESVRTRLGAEIIFTAHHLDDQIETVLMRALSGSGPAGLAGMAPIQGAVVRPLLPFRRAELASYVRESGLESWKDPANTDVRHLRSWIRTELLPSLRERLPRVEPNLERLATHSAAERAAWDAALDVLPGLDLRRENGGISVAASGLEDYDSALIQAVVLALARRVGCQLGPTRARRILQLLAGSSSGTRVPLGGHWNAELAFGRLHIHPVAAAPTLPSWTMEGQSGTGSWGRWRLAWTREAAPGTQGRTGLSAWFVPGILTVRAWAAGEKLTPLGGVGRRLVVRCFQEERVPRSRRESWPVLTQGTQVLWIPGVCRSAAELPGEGTEALRVDAEYA